MTVGRKKRERRNKTFRKGLWITIVCALFFCLSSSYVLKNIVEPNLEDIARIKSEVVVSRIINQTLAEQFADDDRSREFFIVHRDESGTMEMVSADSVAINSVMAKLSLDIQEAFKNMDEEHVDIPVGSLLGSKLLSQTGPKVKVDVVPVSVTSMDFRTEFEEQGINQTKYKVYIVLGCKIKILCPFAYESVETSTKVLVAEAVILGKVPDSYVEVPEEDILDVTEQ